MLKQEIEAALYVYFGDIGTQKDLEDATKQILAYIPNNEWLPYPANKPKFEKKRYNVTYVGGYTMSVLYYEENDSRWYNVIAFKPEPLEPFVQPKNKYVELLEELITKHWDMSARTTGECQMLQELITKIENGELN